MGISLGTLSREVAYDVERSTEDAQKRIRAGECEDDQKSNVTLLAASCFSLLLLLIPFFLCITYPVKEQTVSIRAPL
jgi:hypothetical protein